MSVDYLRPSSTTMYAKRRRANRTLTPLLNSKCGEIFVTLDWNVWTYNCTFCPLNTSDIGVFICHIRLQHSYFESKTNESRRSYSSKQHHQQQQEEEVEKEEQEEEEEEHSNIQDDTDETDSNIESRSSIQDIVTKEDEIVHPIEFISHSNLMSEEAEDLLHQHHNSLETSTEKNVTSVKDHSDTNCTNFTKIINLETLIVRNCDGIVGKKDKVSCNKLKKLHEKKSNTSAVPLNTNAVREYLKSGTFKVKTYVGRSRIWDLFGQIVNNDGDKLQNLVACTKCLSVFKHDGKTTSNLWRHKCVKDIEYI